MPNTRSPVSPLPADDYLEEKRKVTAAMLRRLEIEDWDKVRKSVGGGRVAWGHAVVATLNAR